MIKGLFLSVCLFGLLVAPSQGLIISEFLHTPCKEGGNSSGRFMTLHHDGPGTLDLNGWTISHLDTTAATTISTNVVLQPVVLREVLPNPNPVPFAPSNIFRTVCSAVADTSDLPNCTPLPCSILEVEVASVTCIPSGLAEVVVEISHTNALSVPVQITGSVFDIFNTGASPEIRTYRVPADGSSFSMDITFQTRQLGSVECQTNAMDLVTLPECPSLCEVTNVVPVAVEPCDADGMVRVFFEVYANDAEGLQFGIQQRNTDNASFFTYTNTPITVSLNVPGDGAMLDVVAGQLVPNLFVNYVFNLDCALQADGLFQLPDCNAPPEPCTTPFMLDMRLAPTPSFYFELPAGVSVQLETTPDLATPWTPVMTSPTGTNGLEVLTLPFAPEGPMFYRLVCPD